MRLKWVGWISSLGLMYSPCPTSWSGAGSVMFALHADRVERPQRNGYLLNRRRHFRCRSSDQI
jgi:DMSO/TMAO reductase YedYZ molybdopterin-dependent catalytic subunit